MEVANDTDKQEKQRMAIRGAGNNVGGIVGWGGVAVLAASVVVASISAFKSWKTSKVNAQEADEFAKGNEQTDTPLIDNDALALEIIGKMREDKVENDNKVPNNGNNDVEEDASCLTSNHSLVKGQVNGEKIELQDEMIVAVAKPVFVESDREQAHEFGDKVIKKDEELAEEIEVDTPMSHENEEESDENSMDENSIDENSGEIKKKVQQMEKQQEHHGDEIVGRGLKAALLLNRFQNERKFEIVEKESVQKEEEQEHERKFMVEKEEESNDRNEDDEEEASEKNSEGTGDSSMESNVDAIWPVETMKDVLTEIKHQESDNQITEKIDDYILVESDGTSLTKDTSYTTNNHEVQDSRQSVFNSSKKYTRTLVWAILVLVLALAAPLVLSPKEILNLSLVTFFVISMSRVLKTIV